jgi:hypothetical protein
MADYKELLRRAIEALPENNGTARRAVYEKARSALVSQLHAIEPPIPARQITQHRLTLEDCIRQVEQEATEKLLQGLSHREQEAEVEEAVATPSMLAQQPVAEEVEDVEEAAPVAAPPVEVPAAKKAPAPAAEPAKAEKPAPKAEVVAEEPKAPAKEDEKSKAEDKAADDSFDQAPIEEDFETESAEKEAEAVEEIVEPEVEPQPEAPKKAAAEAPVSSHVEEVVEEEDDVASEPSAVEEDKDDEQEEEAEPFANYSLIEQLQEMSGEETDLNPSSIDDVIAQARAASGAEAPAPSLDGRNNSPAAASVKEALSSVREVDVEPEDLADVDEDDDAQAAIDRALLALDREAEGKKDDDADQALMNASSKGTLAVAAKDELQMVEDHAEFVEDEQSDGGGGLLIFLGVFVLLIGLLGGGTYWAWREGYVNLDPVLEQVGLSGLAVNETPDNNTTNDAPPVTANTDTTPPQTNVRDVTPSSNNTNVTETPTANEGGRLAAESDQDGAGTTEDNTPTETPAGTTDVATADTDGTAGETPDVGANDGRLPSEGDNAPADDTTENPLNVEDPTAQATTGAQSLLIEEQSSGSGGAVPFSGQTQWARDVDELGLPTIRATASIPARNLSVDLLIRKNSDEALPASHLIEVNFTVTESFLGGSVASLPGVLMKDQELAQGTTLVGASVRIVDNSFLFAMSGAETDVARNLELLGQNGWLDLPLIYSTGRKAILTLEKGSAGTELFEEVLAEWANN